MAALLTRSAVPGEVNRKFDIDLRMRGGKTMPVRLYHKLPSAPTLAVRRARRDQPHAQSIPILNAPPKSASCASTIRDGDCDGGQRRRRRPRQRPLRQFLQSLAPGGGEQVDLPHREAIAAFIAAINQAGRQGDRPRSTCSRRWSAAGQFFVTAVEETEAAIVYLLETTERRTQNQINQRRR